MVSTIKKWHDKLWEKQFENVDFRTYGFLPWDNPIFCVSDTCVFYLVPPWSVVKFEQCCSIAHWILKRIGTNTLSCTPERKIETCVSLHCAAQLDKARKTESAFDKSHIIRSYQLRWTSRKWLDQKNRFPGIILGIILINLEQRIPTSRIFTPHVRRVLSDVQLNVKGAYKYCQ